MQKGRLVWPGMGARGSRPPARPLAMPVQLPGSVPTSAAKLICSFLPPVGNEGEGAPVNPVHVLRKPSQAQAFSIACPQLQKRQVQAEVSDFAAA